MPTSPWWERVETPFGQPVDEVMLANPPLVAVIAQLRFPPILSIDNEDFVAKFQEEIRETYPVLSREDQAAVLIGPQGPVTGPHGVLWRFETDPAAWEVSLTKEFLAVSTSTYFQDRDTFIDRIDQIVRAASETINPKVCSRIGLRFVDRVADVEKISSFVIPEALGASEVELGSESIRQLHAVSDVLYEIGTDAALHARWGRIPENLTFDPALEPVGSETWVLDLDAFSKTSIPWDADAITDRARDYCDVIYRYFRWIVTDEFLFAFGAVR